ncbi:GTPase ObgE [Simkania negevensis]|uniref:GTPase Obg n=1 Tax=Simkania negevensis TaxID=83561 RepID=A0ABS3AQ64_9BACT|nr:GTPase ObgE [Simkania negevensis]
MFIDRVALKLCAGKGGDGIIAWRREKSVPKGGPAGGDGGKGGNVVVVASENVSSLEWFHQRHLLKAENGEPGGGSCCHGANGEGLRLLVPCGTVIKERATKEVLCDLVAHGEEYILCRGGKGGRGNTSFKSPTNRAPYKFTHGKEGEECEVELELKLIAEVGLVGFPNAGKSTLISSLAAVRVKIAAYPFTTRYPNLGYVHLPKGSRLLFADIPGIIQGAHKNRGLGFEFLRHIERTHFLLFVLDASGIEERNPYEDLVILREELAEYNPDLLEKPHLVVLNKSDVDDSDIVIDCFFDEYKEDPSTVFVISALHGSGLTELKERLEELWLKV